MATDTTTHPEHADVNYEATDVLIPGVLKAGAALAVLVIVVMVGLVWMFDFFTAREARNKRSQFPLANRDMPPAPLLEAVERKGPSRGMKLVEPFEVEEHAPGKIPPLAGVADFLKDVKVSPSASKKPVVLPSDANSGRSLEGGEE